MTHPTVGSGCTVLPSEVSIVWPAELRKGATGAYCVMHILGLSV